LNHFCKNESVYFLMQFFNRLVFGHPAWRKTESDKAAISVPRSTGCFTSSLLFALLAQFSFALYATYNKEPILRLLNLQLQRQRCSRLERLSK
jgi:hypothetical protein